MAKYKKALIIDDDELFVVVTKYHMEISDFADTILVFDDGQEALRFFQQSNEEDFPDFIFLDINMNFLDGWEFLEALEPLNILDKMVIHITSSSIDPYDLEKSKSHPFIKSFVSKPITADKLRKL